jgi:hypothetical protein
VSVAPIEGQPAGGLKPWREIVTPHPDVASGRYQQAEFAADLGQVYRNEGTDEYRDPREFFRRTFLTEGLRQLLTNAVQRLVVRAVTRWWNYKPTLVAARRTRCWRSITYFLV